MLVLPVWLCAVAQAFRWMKRRRGGSGGLLARCSVPAARCARLKSTLTKIGAWNCRLRWCSHVGSRLCSGIRQGETRLNESAAANAGATCMRVRAARCSQRGRTLSARDFRAVACQELLRKSIAFSLYLPLFASSYSACSGREFPAQPPTPFKCADCGQHAHRIPCSFTRHHTEW